MKFTLSWLQEHLDTSGDATSIAATLNRIGLEVEQVTDRAAALEGFVVGHVVECGRHPDADRLKLCRVDIGAGEPIQVVCGAANAHQGMKGVFAPVGAVIPATGDRLKKGKIRGQESFGMLCSARELELSEEHDGIIELPADAAIGAPVAAVMGLDDPVFEIGLTPNRADCAGVRGIARDLAAAGLGTLKPLARRMPVAGSYASPLKVRIAAPEACPHFIGRHFRGLNNGPSPDWLQDRLRAIGLRPISRLVDITNLISFDLARPLHVFDAARLTGDLEVRLSAGGEEMPALDDRTYQLAPGMVVIADPAGPQALGGVVGGVASGCSDDTTEVFLEVALFDPVRTALTGQALNIVSDARYRFERGVDPQFLAEATDIATNLILELCGGEASEIVVAGAPPAPQGPIRFDPARVAALGGVEVPASEQVAILTALGFTIAEAGGGLDVTPPSWRRDIDGPADLVEEVLRIRGYDGVPSVPLTRPDTLTRPAVGLARLRAGRIRRALAMQGLSEAVSFSFISRASAAAFGETPEGLQLSNPIAADLDQMRPSILPGLVAAAARNVARGFPEVALFELGPVFASPEPDGQQTVAGGLRTHAEALTAKADCLAALAAGGAPVDSLRIEAARAPGYHPGQCGELRLGKAVLARFGSLHPALAEDHDLPATALFEVFLDAIPEPRKSSIAKPLLKLSPLMPVRRDFAFLVDEAVPAGEVLSAVRAADKNLIEEVTLFDVYRGKGVAEGQKSLALRVTLQPTDQTLTEAELQAVSDAITASVAQKTGGSLRG